MKEITPEYVTEDYFSGGLANYIFRVSKALVGMGHEVHVITLSTMDVHYDLPKCQFLVGKMAQHAVAPGTHDFIRLDIG